VPADRVAGTRVRGRFSALGAWFLDRLLEIRGPVSKNQAPGARNKLPTIAGIPMPEPLNATNRHELDR
jgi:hypothetical protein